MDLFKQQYQQFETIWEIDANGVEFIYARDLQALLGYKEWRKFQKPISKSKDACISNSYNPDDHFVHVDKMVKTGSGASRKIDDIKLTRYAGYLIAMNGDSRKSEIAFAQNYFAVQTRKFERIIERMNQIERIESREKLKDSEKEFSRVMYERGVSGKGFGIVKSKGDKAFFGGKDTRDMKKVLNVPEKRTLADYTSKAVNLGRALANTVTTMNVEKDDLCGVNNISIEHVKSNTNIRSALVDSGVYPERTPAEDDIKKVERSLKKEEKAIAKKLK